MIEYEMGDGPEFSQETWLSQKFNLGLDFPNLPYFIDGDFKLTESFAIHKYIADKWKPELLGTDAQQRANVNMLANVILELKTGITLPCYKGDKEPIMNTIATKVPPVVNFLGDSTFLTGSSPTWMDFYFYSQVEKMVFLTEGQVLKDYPSLEKYQKSVSSLPGLKEYLEDPQCLEKSRLINNKHAVINNKL